VNPSPPVLQPSRSPDRALDAVNFFLADVRDGLGPYLAIYLLAVHKWEPASIGAVMTVAGLAALVAQTPAGALIDRVNGKRATIVIAAILVTVSCLVLPWTASFTLVALHVIWGDGSADRLPEVTEIARWMADWAGGGDAFGTNLMALGDFNIDRLGEPLYQAFVATGLTPAPGHVGLPRTIFSDPTKPHFYDQVAWFSGSNGTPMLSPPLRYDEHSGNFDFRAALQGSLSTTELSWRISDHYPLWVSFAVRPDA
jgi:MFS family permease